MEHSTMDITILPSSDVLKPNASPTMQYEELRSSAEVGIQVFIATVCGCLAAVGNTLLIIAMHKEPSLRRSNTNRIIESLAWTDVINAFLVIPFFCVSLAEGKWVLGENFCYVEAFLLALTTFATLDSLTILAVSRLLKVVFNKTYRKILGSPKKTNTAIALVWLVSAITSGTPIFGWGAYAYIPKFYVCTLEWHPKHGYYLVFVNILSTYPATLLVIICYIWIYLYYRVTARRMILHSRPDNIPNDQIVKSKRQKDIRLLKITGAVVLFYLMCWFPVAVVLNLTQHGVPLPRGVAILPPFLKFINSCGNPIFYVVMDHRIRKAVFRVIACCKAPVTREGVKLDKRSAAQAEKKTCTRFWGPKLNTSS